MYKRSLYLGLTRPTDQIDHDLDHVYPSMPLWDAVHTAAHFLPKMYFCLLGLPSRPLHRFFLFFFYTIRPRRWDSIAHRVLSWAYWYILLRIILFFFSWLMPFFCREICESSSGEEWAFIKLQCALSRLPCLLPMISIRMPHHLTTKTFMSLLPRLNLKLHTVRVNPFTAAVPLRGQIRSNSK